VLCPSPCTATVALLYMSMHEVATAITGCYMCAFRRIVEWPRLLCCIDYTRRPCLGCLALVGMLKRLLYLLRVLSGSTACNSTACEWRCAGGVACSRGGVTTNMAAEPLVRNHSQHMKHAVCTRVLVSEMHEVVCCQAVPLCVCCCV
jgi:hypothetical protein